MIFLIISTAVCWCWNIMEELTRCSAIRYLSMSLALNIVFPSAIKSIFQRDHCCGRLIFIIRIAGVWWMASKPCWPFDCITVLARRLTIGFNQLTANEYGRGITDRSVLPVTVYYFYLPLYFIVVRKQLWCSGFNFKYLPIWRQWLFCLCINECVCNGQNLTLIISQKTRSKWTDLLRGYSGILSNRPFMKKFVSFA